MKVTRTSQRTAVHLRSQSGPCLKWSTSGSLGKSSDGDVNSWKKWRLKWVAFEGTSLYKRSCDGSRWLTAGEIIFYRRRNSALVCTRKSVDDEKAFSKFHILLKGLNDFVPIIYLYLDSQLHWWLLFWLMIISLLGIHELPFAAIQNFGLFSSPVVCFWRCFKSSSSCSSSNVERRIPCIEACSCFLVIKDFGKESHVLQVMPRTPMLQISLCDSVLIISWITTPCTCGIDIHQ